MIVDLWPLPLNLEPRLLEGRIVVVFDVLRATTSMASAIATGAKEIHIFGSLDAAATASAGFDGAKLLCGERRCLAPPGFDMGNSPVDFSQDRVRDKTLFMSTTNGTKAIVAASAAAGRMAGSLVNAAATARALARAGKDVTLLCSGTDGKFAPEDIIGAGAVFVELEKLIAVERNDTTTFGVKQFEAARGDLASALRDTQGGRNILRAGLERDIEFASQLNKFDIPIDISGEPPVARRMIGA